MERVASFIEEVYNSKPGKKFKEGKSSRYKVDFTTLANLNFKDFVVVELVNRIYRNIRYKEFDKDDILDCMNYLSMLSEQDANDVMLKAVLDFEILFR